MSYKTDAERREEAPSKGELAFQDAVDKAYAARWWETHDNVAVTASFMAEMGHDAHEVALLVEKPWKFTDEYVNAMSWIGEDDIGAYIDTTPPTDEPVDEDIFRGER